MYAPKCVPSCIAVGNDGYDVMTSSGTGSEWSTLKVSRRRVPELTSICTPVPKPEGLVMWLAFLFRIRVVPGVILSGY
jgi:hypothetical protein